MAGTDDHSPVNLNKIGNSYRVYAFHGVSKGETVLKNNNTAVFSGVNISPQAGFTIFVNWEKGSLKIKGIKKLMLNLPFMDMFLWGIFGLIVPLVALSFILIIYYRQRKSLTPIFTRESANQPPMELSPFFLGILLEKKITPRVLLGEIIDLCQRGYLVVFKENNRYILGKRKELDENLTAWEKSLVEELFPSKALESNENINAREKSQLYSQKIKVASEKA
jgi:hypothetical protein